MATCHAAGQAPESDIVLGMSAAFSGPSRALGIELYRGAAAYLETVNEAGGVHGRAVRIAARDDGYEPLPAIENTIELLADDRVVALFGYVGTPTTTRILPLLRRPGREAKMLFFPFTGAQPLRRPPYDVAVVNLRASYADETSGLVERFLTLGRERIGVYYQADAYGRSGWSGVRDALRGRGRKIAAEATYRRGDKVGQSYAAQVDLLRDVDAVVSVGSYEACAGFIRDARDVGLEVPIANVSFVGSERMLELLTEMGQRSGKDYTRHLINSQVVPSYEDESVAAVREYRQVFSRQVPLPRGLAAPDYRPQGLSFVSFEGFLDAKLMVEILRRAGPDPDSAALRRAAEEGSDLEIGVGLPVSYSGADHDGLDDVFFTTVVDGHFETVVDWSPFEK